MHDLLRGHRFKPFQTASHPFNPFLPEFRSQTNSAFRTAGKPIGRLGLVEALSHDINQTWRMN